MISVYRFWRDFGRDRDAKAGEGAAGQDFDKNKAAAVDAAGFEYVFEVGLLF